MWDGKVPRENQFDFAQRMGCGSVKLPNGVTLFENGGVSRPNNDLFGYHENPSGDMAERLQAQRAYWRARLSLAESAFFQLKSRLTGGVDKLGFPLAFVWDTAEFGPMPREREDCYGRLTGEASLAKLAEIVNERRAGLAKIEAELPANRARAERLASNQRCDEAAQEQADRAQHAIERINI
jgi:hypothetical protein